MIPPIPLLDEIGSTGVEACVISTYSIHLPFFETVVLPRVASAGSRYTVVLADAGQCSRAVQDPSGRPRLAGQEYALLPIHMSGGSAFHPKILLLAGRQGGRLYVGSHNLTLAGFTRNRELTNRFVIEGRSDVTGVANARAAWAGLLEWCGSIPDRARSLLEGVQRAVPWLTGPRAASSSEAEVVVSAPQGPSLWDALSGRFPSRVARAIVIGAFFDESLEFLRTLRDSLSPRELVVGIDPDTVEINAARASRLPKTRFVNAAAVSKGHGYLHAKAIALELQGGEEVLITGSANPSRPAWTADSATRNAEAVVVRRGGRGESLINSLGLARLADLDALDHEDWATIQRRRDATESAREPSRAVTLAFREPGAYTIDTGPLPPSPVEVVLLETPGVAQATPIRGPLVVESGGLKFGSQKPVADGALFELIHQSGARSLALPYYAVALANRAQTGVQQALRQAMASLDGGVPQVEELLRLVERVVFDKGMPTPTEAAEAVRPTPSKRKGDTSSATPPGANESLAANLDGASRRHSHHGRQVLSGDLIALLDALIRRLGMGMEKPSAELDESLPAPDDGRVDDDDRKEDSDALRDGDAIAAHCRRKVSLLLNRRLVPRLEKAAQAIGGEAFRAAAQTAAILSLVKTLRGLQLAPPKPFPRYVILVEPEAAKEFLWSSTTLLCSPASGLLRAALAELKAAAAEEVSIARGLLVWLGWVAGLDIQWAARGSDRDELREQLLDLAGLLPALQDASGDPLAVQHARDALARTCPPRALPGAAAWLERHIAWGRAVEAVGQRPGAARLVSRPPVPGDIVVTRGAETVPRLVVEVIPGRISVADPRHEERVRMFAGDYVSVLEIPIGRVAVA